MNIYDAFPSAFLKATDMKGKRFRITMDRVEIHEFDDGNKPVLYFVGKEQALVLNRTKSNAISDQYGTETDNWHGKQIILGATKVAYQGKMVDAISVEFDVQAAPISDIQAPITPPPQQQAARPATPRGQPIGGNGQGMTDDEIPF